MSIGTGVSLDISNMCHITKVAYFYVRLTGRYYVGRYQSVGHVTRGCRCHIGSSGNLFPGIWKPPKEFR